MEYQIEYANGQCHSRVRSRKDLLEWFQLLKEETITDIKKIYKSGSLVSVLDKYKRYITHF